MGRLTNLFLKTAAAGSHQDGEGLFITRTAKGGRWYYRYSHLGKRRDMGLGSYPVMSLADARKERDKWRNVLSEGNDPIEARRSARALEVEEREKHDPTFEELTMMVFEAKKARLRGDGMRGRWLSPFTTHLFPRLGKKLASSLTAHDFKNALRPIWKDMQPTCEKAVQRSRLVLRQGQFLGYDVNPVIVDQAAALLGEVVHVTTPIPSTPWQDIPSLYERLPMTSAGQCLRLMILTLVRLDGCAGALCREFEDGVWTVPPDRVKGTEGKVQEFRVPVSRAAHELVTDQSGYVDDVLFPGQRGAPITDRALELCLDGMKEVGRPHGFRASFRTWSQETDQPWDVCEMVLGHKVGNVVERAYARSDLLDRRRVVMDKWGDYVTRQSADVVKLRG